MDIAILARSKGYAWALEHPDSAQDEKASYDAYYHLVAIPEGMADDAPDEAYHQETWRFWQHGVEDAAGNRLSVAHIAAAMNMRRAYINAEIERGNLPAALYGSTYLIRPSDFKRWKANPRRGTRQK